MMPKTKVLEPLGLSPWTQHPGEQSTWQPEEPRTMQLVTEEPEIPVKLVKLIIPSGYLT